MMVPFNTLPDQSRLWIFQADRLMDNSELEALSKALSSFVEGWNSHGMPTEASFEFRYNRFLLIAANEQVNAVGGCSIDGLVMHIEHVGKQHQLQFLDRSVAFLVNNQVQTLPLVQARTAVQQGVLTTGDLVFNNTITVKGDLGGKWLVPIEKSWLQKYMPAALVQGTL